MAETADPSPSGVGESSPTAAAPAPGRDAVGRAVPRPSTDAPEPYRPISLMAIVGFGLAIAYSLVVGGGSLIAFLSGKPWLLSGWTVIFPVAAVLVCWYARQGIFASEGTLGGAKLAGWGMGLCIGFALCYWAYYAATYLAVRQQAAAFVEGQYLKKLMEGKIEEAFLLTLPPPRPNPDPAALRGLLEVNYNTPRNPYTVGPYSKFAQHEYVRLMQLVGDQTKFRQLSAATPTFEKGGIQVPLTYRVDTPVVSFDMLILASGGDSKSKETPGRQWHIVNEQTGVQKESRVPTDEGRELFQSEAAARSFVQTWANKVSTESDTKAAYLATLPPSQRAALAAKLQDKGEEAIAKLANDDPAVRDFRTARDRFVAGGIVRADKKTFWSSEAQRADIIASVKKAFTPLASPPGWLSVPTNMPAFVRDGQKLIFHYDALILLMPKWQVGARIVVEADIKDLAGPPQQRVDAWHIVALELERGRTAPTGQGVQ